MVGDARAAGDAGPPVTVVAPSRSPHPFEMWISHTLRVGVVISGTILATGLVLFLARGTASGHPSSLHELIHTPSSTVSLASTSGVDIVVFASFNKDVPVADSQQIQYSLLPVYACDYAPTLYEGPLALDPYINRLMLRLPVDAPRGQRGHPA